MNEIFDHGACKHLFFEVDPGRTSQTGIYNEYKYLAYD